MGVLYRAVSFRAFHRLPAVTVRTPRDQKADNRSMARLLSNFTECISGSKPRSARKFLSGSASITYAHTSLERSNSLVPKLGLFPLHGVFSPISKGWETL